MNDVLVVGGAGYVGSHMVKHLLARGHSVTVFDNLSRGHREAAQTAKFVTGDLASHADLRSLFNSQRFDVVMHFAAYCYVGESVSNPRSYYRNNVVGTLNLLDAMLDAHIDKLVFSSTCSTYGVPPDGPISESTPQRPVNPYGASKLMVERILADYAFAYSLNSISLRYFNAAGSDPEGEIGECHEPETHLIPLALREALRLRSGGKPSDTSLVVHGDDYETPDGTCVRDYVHVEDLASAHLSAAQQLMDCKARGAVAYNLGIERGFSVIEVIDACRKVTGQPIEFRVGPRRPGDPPQLVASSGAARRDLNWTPRYTELQDIVETAWRWSSRDRATSAKPA